MSGRRPPEGRWAWRRRRPGRPARRPWPAAGPRYEAGGVAGVVPLLADDAWVTMPLAPLQYQGQEMAGRFLSAVAFRGGRRHRLVAVGAIGQPAVGAYEIDPRAGSKHADGLLVLWRPGRRVSAITRFGNSVLPAFGLPWTLH